LRLYVYPCREEAGKLTTAGTLPVAAHLRHLHQYLLENQSIQELRGFDEHCLPISSKEVLAKIRSGDDTWENMVPPQVAQMIKERHLFGFREPVHHG
jgi:nicotinic acid mononucleotide adenylyltransferase